MAKFEFEIETVKKRVVEVDAKSLEEAKKQFDDLIEKDMDSKYSDLWDAIYKADITEDEKIMQIKHKGKMLIKKGEVVWKSTG